jgi:hypothetical protein
MLRACVRACLPADEGGHRFCVVLWLLHLYDVSRSRDISTSADGSASASLVMIGGNRGAV